MYEKEKNYKDYLGDPIADNHSFNDPLDCGLRIYVIFSDCPYEQSLANISESR